MVLIDNSTFLIYKLLNYLSNILNRFLKKYGIKNDHNVMIIHVYLQTKWIYKKIKKVK